MYKKRAPIDAVLPTHPGGKFLKRSKLLTIAGLAAGVLGILVAVWMFDATNQRQIGISLLLFVGGLNSIVGSLRSRRLHKINKLLTLALLIISAVMLFNLL